VWAERCYGCGRCLPACPLGLIEERQQLLPAEAVASLLAEIQPDAVELHTCIGRGAAAVSGGELWFGAGGRDWAGAGIYSPHGVPIGG
jgi:ferredoxin